MATKLRARSLGTCAVSPLCGVPPCVLLADSLVTYRLQHVLYATLLPPLGATRRAMIADHVGLAVLVFRRGARDASYGIPPSGQELDRQSSCLTLRMPICLPPSRRPHGFFSGGFLVFSTLHPSCRCSMGRPSFLNIARLWGVALLMLASRVLADVQDADDTNVGMFYTGLWVPDGDPNTFGKHDTWTNQSGASVVFDFIGKPDSVTPLRMTQTRVRRYGNQRVCHAAAGRDVPLERVLLHRRRPAHPLDDVGPRPGHLVQEQGVHFAFAPARAAPDHCDELWRDLLARLHGVHRCERSSRRKPTRRDHEYIQYRCA